MKNEFAEQYRNLTDAELIDILANKADYQPAALKAAQQELDGRNLSKEELEAAHSIQRKLASNKKAKKDRQQAQLDKVKQAANSLVNTLHPIQQEKPTAQRLIHGIAILLTIFYLYDLISNYKTNSLVLSDFDRFPASSFIALWPLIILPLALIFFWLKKTIGWILLMVYIAYSASYTLWIISHLAMEDASSSADAFFPAPSIGTFIIAAVLYIGIFLLLSRKDIRRIYKINESKMILSIAIGVGLTLFAMFIL